jgi:2-oxoglutarate dehydrogenase E1 component
MMQQYFSNSYLFGGNAPYVEELYEAYLLNPGSVPENWRSYFDAMQHVPAVDGFRPPRCAACERGCLRLPSAPNAARFVPSPLQVMPRWGANAFRLYAADRRPIASWVRQWANLDPLQRQERPTIPELEPPFYGFGDADLDTVFNISNTYFGPESASLRDLLQALRDTYCRSIGAEFQYITDPTQKRWMQERLESTRATGTFTVEEKQHILDRITAAEGLERLPPHQICRAEAFLARRR